MALLHCARKGVGVEPEFGGWPDDDIPRKASEKKKGVLFPSGLAHIKVSTRLVSMIKIGLVLTSVSPSVSH